MTPVPKPSVPPPTGDNKKWCVPKVEATDPELQANIDYVCGQGMNCQPIQLGGVCFEPDNVRAHASFVMNAFYQTYSNCYFSGSGMITSTDPSTYRYLQIYFLNPQELDDAMLFSRGVAAIYLLVRSPWRFCIMYPTP
ncbi:hypothetical protein OROMI_006976 [Orobanche minor]